MDLQAERERVLSQARTIVDGVKSSGRTDLSIAEQDQVAAGLARVKDLDKQIAGRKMTDAVRALGKGIDWSERSPVFSDEARAGILHAAKTRTAYRTEVPAKALLTVTTMLPPSGDGVAPGLHPNVYPLSSLFAQQPADGPIQRYWRMSSGTAAVVPEGGLKPDAGIGVLPVDLTLEKIAALAQFSDEMGDYSPYLVDHIQQEKLAAAVATTENARIVAAFNATSGVLTGAGTDATVVDAIADAIAGQEAISGLTPTCVIAGPTVVAAIRKTKASTAGVYLLDPTAAGPTAIWGTPVISTPVVPATTVYVVEQSGITLYRRGGLAVTVGFQTGDFEHNLQTARAEERIGTAVMRPSCLTKITLS